MTQPKWTAATMFLHPERGFTTDPFELVRGRLTPEFLAWVNTGEEWVLDSSTKIKYPMALSEPVGTGELECPFCKGTTEYGVPHVGVTSGMRMIRYRDCPCMLWTRFWKAWKEVPERFAKANLKTMVPMATMSISLERQREIRDELRDKPNDSYYLYGPVGTGKTYFATALYRIALMNALKEQFEKELRCTSVWRISALQLLKENTDWNQRDLKDPNCPIPAPTLTAKMIELVAKKYGQRPCLFLDELDKFAMTDAKAAVLWEIVDEVYKHNGQLVTTANFGYDQLIAKWGRELAGTVVRRFGIGDKQHSILFNNQVTVAAPTNPSAASDPDDLFAVFQAARDNEGDTPVLSVHRPVSTSKLPPSPAPLGILDATRKQGAISHDFSQ